MMTIPGKETQGNKIRKLELLFLSDNGSKIKFWQDHPRDAQEVHQQLVAMNLKHFADQNKFGKPPIAWLWNLANEMILLLSV